MSHTLTKHGGWVNKFMGDGILVLFGLSNENDAAANAVAAAIEIQKQMSQYTWKMRVGVASGKFIVGEFGTEDLRRFDCLGHIVNLASRLQSEAKEDEVIICSRTHELLIGKFNFSESKKISPKGIGEVVVYNIIF